MRTRGTKSQRLPSVARDGAGVQAEKEDPHLKVPTPEYRSKAQCFHTFSRELGCWGLTFAHSRAFLHDPGHITACLRGSVVSSVKREGLHGIDEKRTISEGPGWESGAPALILLLALRPQTTFPPQALAVWKLVELDWVGGI